MWFDLEDPKVQREILAYIQPLTKGAAPQFTDEYGNPDYINWLQYSTAEGQPHAARLP